MAYDKTKFNALRSLEVPYRLALALSDNNSPLKPTVVAPVADIPSPGTATAAVTAAKVNELLAALRAAGVLGP